MQQRRRYQSRKSPLRRLNRKRITPAEARRAKRAVQSRFQMN